MAANTTSNWYATDDQLGDMINLTQTISVTTAPETPAPFQTPGNRVQGNNNSVWMLVKASTTVTSANILAIDANFNANNGTSALLASLAYTVGVAQFGGSSITSSLTQQTAQPGDYFWACMQASGGILINCTGSTLRGAQLYVSSGVLGSVTTSVSTVALRFPNIVVNTTFAPSGSNTTTDFIISTPTVVSV